MKQYHTELILDGGGGGGHQDSVFAGSHQEAAEKVASHFHDLRTGQGEVGPEAGYVVHTRELYDPIWKEYLVEVSGKKPLVITSEERPTTRNPSYTKKKKEVKRA